MILKVEKISNVGGIVKAPPSKSYTHRAVIIASLAQGNSKLYDPLVSEDTLASVNICRTLGAEINTSNSNSMGNKLNSNIFWEINGTEKIKNSSKDPIDLKNSGTTLRIMTSVASLSQNGAVLTGDDSLKTRPMDILLKALKSLGTNAKSIPCNGKPPIKIEPGFIGGKTSINGNISSQFISSLLIAGAISPKGIDLEIKGDLISKPYVTMTLDIMEKFGIKIETNLLTKNINNMKKSSSISFSIKPQKYKATEYTIEGDYSSASYLLGAIAILGGKITVQNLFSDSKQGDKLILTILKKMGAEIEIDSNSVTLTSNGNLNGIDINLHNAPDLLPTVAVLGALANGKTSITKVKHARYKETDRIAKCTEELTKLGCEIKEKKDGIKIKKGINTKKPPTNKITSHNDHRLAMAFTLISLKNNNIIIENGNTYKISFPNFIQTMKKIGIQLTTT